MLAVVFQGVTVVLLLSKIHFCCFKKHILIYPVPSMSNMHDVLQQDGSAFVTCHGSFVQWGKLQRPTTADSKKKTPHFGFLK